MKLKTGILVAAIAALFGVRAASAASVTVYHIVGGSNAGEPINATATFSFTTNSLDITLTNDTNNPHSASSLLGGVIFTITGPGSASSPSGLQTTGTLIDISSGSIQPYGGNVNNELNHWSLMSSPNPDKIQVAGNDPLIIGYGNGGLATSPYSNANPSLTGGPHQPFVQHSATIHMSIAGLTVNSDVTGVSLAFGTGYAYTTATFVSHTPDNPGGSGATPTPLPAAVWGGMALMSAMGAGKMIKRRRSV